MEIWKHKNTQYMRMNACHHHQLQPSSTHGQSGFIYVPIHFSTSCIGLRVKSKHSDCFQRYFIKSSLAGLRAIFLPFQVTFDISALIRTRPPESNFYISPGRALTVILIAQEYHSEHCCPGKQKQQAFSVLPGLGPRAGSLGGAQESTC